MSCGIATCNMSTKPPRGAEPSIIITVPHLLVCLYILLFNKASQKLLKIIKCLLENNHNDRIRGTSSGIG